MKRTAIVAILALFGGAAGFAATQLAPVQTSGSVLNPAPGDTAMQKKDDPVEDFETLHDGLQVSDYLRGEILAQGGTSIAVLVPFAMTRDEVTAKAHGFKLKISNVGYTAVMGDAVLDTVINGAAGDASQDDYMRPYEDFDDGRGGSLAFGFRGADYQVEMYCLADAPDPETNCLEAARLEAFVGELTGQ